MARLAPTEPAQPLGQRARGASVMLGVVIVASAVSFWADLDQYNAISRVVDGQRVPLSDLQSIDDRVGAASTVYTITLILSVITFLLWFSRAYRNLGALGVRELRYSPAWAVGSWFVPILSLFRPKQAINDIWRASDPDREAAIAEPGKGAVSPLLHWWWAIWLLSNWVGTLAVRLSFEHANPTPTELKSEAMAYLLADIADIAAGVLAILVIRALTERQSRRLTRLGGLGGAPSSAVSPASVD